MWNINIMNLIWLLKIFRFPCLRWMFISSTDFVHGLTWTVQVYCFHHCFKLSNSTLKANFNLKTIRYDFRGELHINFCAHCTIMTQRSWPSHRLLFASFHIFDKIDSFQKKMFGVSRIKEGKLNLRKTV